MTHRRPLIAAALALDALARAALTRAALTLAALATLALAVRAPAAIAQGAAKSAPPIGSVHGATSGEARTVRGRVMRGGRTALQPVAGAGVVLHRVGTDRAAPLDSTRTDGAGRFAFNYRTSGDPKAVYFASSVFGGVAYFTMPLTSRAVSGEDATLVVHDTTSAPVPIRTRARHLVLSAPGEKGQRTVTEIFELSNDSTLTRVAAGDTGAVWEAILLDGARDARVGEADFSGGAVRFEQGRIRLAAPFAPGLKQFSYSYAVPLEDEYAFHMDAPAGVLEVLVEDALGRAEGGALKAAGQVTAGERTFARFVAQDVPAGAVIRVRAPGERAVSGTQLRVLVIVTALGAVLLVGLARTMMRRQGGTRRAAMAADAVVLRAQLATLDAAFAKIKWPTPEQRADHWQARAHLDKQISDAVAREQGLP